jgi:quercetin dioxygenase-like cupin family protein
MRESVDRPAARRIVWSDLEADHPMPLLERRRVHGDRMTVARIQLRKGFRIDPHAHDEEQITVVLSGKLRFLVGDPGSQTEVIVGADELLHLPANVPHGAEALEETIVLDLFSPPAKATGIDRAGG